VDVSARFVVALRAGALALALVLLVLGLALVAFGFLVAGFCLWLASHLGAPAATAITGASLLVLGVLVAVVGALKLRPPPAAPQQAAPSSGATALSLASSLLGALVRSTPKGALIGALLLGMLTEFLSPTPPKRPPNDKA
jgi:hypothetical protein